ncbi:hypothetical protein V8G54_032089 [Vigna mungo]|uniref:Uncharacterized protein n=1 Tax=Vigna mungo TaxID=3915 RepID=A0AAQ3MKN7_VIGMU
MLLKLKEKFYSIRQVTMLLSPESNKLKQTNRKPCQINKIKAQCPLCKSPISYANLKVVLARNFQFFTRLSIIHMKGVTITTLFFTSSITPLIVKNRKKRKGIPG